MIQIRRSAERGHFDHGWLDTRHTFSFGDYFDPRHMGFSTFRVLNDDVVAPGQGFGTHPHSDMEIVTIVLEGALSHRDSLGTGSTIVPFEVQRMSAGRGIRHSEFNASKTEPVHLLQLWIETARRGIEPSYEQKAFDPASIEGRLTPLVTPDGRDGTLRMHQDATILRGRSAAGGRLEHRFAPGRRGWLHVIAGGATVGGETLGPGDGVAIADVDRLELEAKPGTDVLLLDLA